MEVTPSDKPCQIHYFQSSFYDAIFRYMKNKINYKSQYPSRFWSIINSINFYKYNSALTVLIIWIQMIITTFGRPRFVYPHLLTFGSLAYDIVVQLSGHGACSSPSFLSAAPPSWLMVRASYQWQHATQPASPDRSRCAVATDWKTKLEHHYGCGGCGGDRRPATGSDARARQG